MILQLRGASDFLGEIDWIASQVQPADPCRFTFLETSYAVVHSDTSHGIQSGVREENLGRLANELYSRIYCRVPADAADQLATNGPGVDLAPSLARANETRSRPPSLEQAGFFSVSGEESWDADSAPVDVVRIYWNIAAKGAIALLGMLTAQLNRYRVPFRFKCMRHSLLYTRADAAVLYTPRSFASIVVQIVHRCDPRIRPHLREKTPLFTRALRPGLAYAEDPGGNESFGQQRCRLLASSMIAAFEQVAGARFEGSLLVEQLKRHGIDPLRPHLKPHSKDIDAFEMLEEA